MVHPQIENINAAIAPYRQQLLQHPLYAEIKHVSHLQSFMQHHMFAVWDFMSLLKALQIELTCTSLPWIPQGNASLRRFINEIVMGEESDLSSDGIAASHFELYHEAMQLADASTEQIDHFISLLRRGHNVNQAMEQVELSESVRQFVSFSFDTIRSNKIHTVAAIFTFGREDLIPDMFTALVKDLQTAFPGKLDKLVYYLERHIELDGGEHGPLALQMIAELCGYDAQKWEEAKTASVEALKVRIALWDGILAEIKDKVLVA